MFGNIGGPAILIFIGVLISASGAIWASIEQTKSESNLRAKSDEIAELNKEISKSIIGGDSFAYLTPTVLAGSNYPESLMILHQGNYPLYDLSLRVVDLDDFEAELAKPKGTINLLNVGVNQTAGNIPPSTASFSGISMKEKDFTRLTIQISARNGHFTQSLRIKKVGTEYKSAIQVSKMDGGSEPIFEKIDDGYPLNKESKVDW